MTNDAQRDGRPGGWDAPEGAERQPTGSWAWLASGFGTPADRHNQVRMTVWALVWMMSFLAADQILKGNLGFGLAVEGPSVWLVAMFPNVLAIGVLLSYLRFLRMADELTRLVQIQGLAVGFGTWFFFFLGWQLLEDAGAGPLGDEVPILVPVFAMMAGQLYFAWRYR